MDGKAFMAAAQEFNQEFLDSKMSDWMPDEGEYLTIGCGFKVVEYNREDGRQEPAIIPNVKILAHPELDGRKFQLGFFGVSWGSRMGVMFHPKTNADPDNVQEFYETCVDVFGGNIEESADEPEGKLMTIEVSSYIKKNGESRKQAKIIDYPPVTESEAQEPPEVQEEAPVEPEK